MKQMQQPYRGFEIAWTEPPLTSAGYSLNISSNDADLMALLESKTDTRNYVLTAKPPIEDALRAGEKFIDGTISGGG